MNLKKMIIILCITIFIMFGLLFGASYAWYAYSNAEAQVEGRTINERPTVIFAQTDRIVASENMPIDDIDRYNYAHKNSFTITLGENLKQYESAIEISLINIKISEELKTSNYKYELLENGIAIANGDFGNIGNQSSIKLKPLAILEHMQDNVTYNYDLYVWLSDDGTNQNELMSKGFSAKININSAIKRAGGSKWKNK